LREAATALQLKLKLPETSVKAYNVLQGDETFKRQLAAADASRLHTVVDNRLGVAARMELDFGDNM